MTDANSQTGNAFGYLGTAQPRDSPSSLASRFRFSPLLSVSTWPGAESQLSAYIFPSLLYYSKLEVISDLLPTLLLLTLRFKRTTGSDQYVLRLSCRFLGATFRSEYIQPFETDFSPPRIPQRWETVKPILTITMICHDSISIAFPTRSQTPKPHIKSFLGLDFN
jgi:hypothetical protein